MQMALRKVYAQLKLEEGNVTNEIWPWWPTVTAGIAAVVSLIGVAVTVKGNRSTAHEIEKLRSQGAEHLENISHKNRLRMAALEKRLDVHQKAYTMCHGLNSVCMYSKDSALITPYINECQRLVVQNRLYLEANVAEEITSMLAGVVLGIHGETMDHVKAQWDKVREAILKAMGLPSIAGEGDWRAAELEEPHDVDG